MDHFLSLLLVEAKLQKDLGIGDEARIEKGKHNPVALGPEVWNEKVVAFVTHRSQQL